MRDDDAEDPGTVSKAAGRGVPLKGRYELLETPRTDGEACVVKAIDHQRQREVALTLRPVGSDQGRDDLLREARALRALAPHPSLPPVLEDFFDGDRYVVVTDWVDGTDLGRLLRDQGTPGLPLSSVLAYLAEAADALTFLHQQEPPIVHGNVEPANLILTRGGHVKLVDLGLSSTVSIEGEHRATAGFRAPEIEAGTAPSRASDVYSLAATAFALLTGARPADDPAALESVAVLDAVIKVGLAADPGLRPGTPGELVERLRSGWASTLPTGVMTFCMTDIEGSTGLWDSHPGAMAKSLVRHDELIAGAVEAHGGRFLKSMGEGDSTTSVFDSAPDAVGAAIDAACALAGEPWPDGISIRARVGLHTGEAQRRDGDYFGTTVNLAARVRGEASGGEILLSETTAALASGDLPAGYAFVGLGLHRLKGIRQPQAIKALTGPGLGTAVAECPYRGLLAFEPRDRHLFFGREEVVADVLRRIAPGRLLTVVGASGSGKSSLLRAGVLAAVDAGELPAVGVARLITPGAEPPLELSGAEHELLIVDQFEELYTQCRDAARRARFTAALLTRKGPVVIGVRADFYGELSGDAKLAGAVAQNQVLLSPMRDDDLRRAIAQPARLAGLRLEPGLIDVVLRDVAGEPGALPLMSHALRETWERRDGRTLTVEAYHESGGVSSAVAQTADAVADGTPESDRPLLRSVFLRLTEIGDGVDDTRRCVRIEELVPQDFSAEAVNTLLERLVRARLVTLGDGTAEVAHEVLIRRWPTLRRWLEEDREGIRLHRRLGDAARLWDVAEREPADLYRGTRLDAAVEWARFNGTALNSTERDFLNASIDDASLAHRRQLRANRRLRRALGASAGLLLAAGALLVFALVSRHDAKQSEASARSQALATESESQIGGDPQRALLLARAALKAAPTPEAELAASEALDANTARSQLPSFGLQNCQVANFLFVLDHGHTAADNTCDGHVVFADLVRNRIARSVRVGPTSTDMVLGPTGQTFIIGTGNDLVSMDIRTGRVRHLITAPFPIEQIAGSPGHFLAIADTSRVALVDLKRHRVRVIAHGDASANAINGMMSASADLLLVATLGQSRGQGDLLPRFTVLDVAHGTRGAVTFTASPHVAAVNFLRVSPDQRTWYVTGADINTNNDAQVATTWAVDAQTRRVKWAAPGPLGALGSPVQVSPDNRRVAVAYSSGAADVLDAATGRRVVRDSSSSSIVAGDVAFPPGDDKLVTVSLDGVFRTWSARGSEQLRFQAPADPAMDFTPDGKDLVLVGERGEVVERRTARVVRRFPGFAAGSVFNSCNAACFAASPGLRWLTYLDPTSATPRILEIDGRTGRPITTVTVPRLDAQGVAPDGAIVAAYASQDRLFARVIEPGTGRVRDLPPGDSSDGCAATTPTFTPDSRLMAIVDACLHVVVWDLRSGRVQRTIALPDRSNGSGAQMSPDGRYVLVSVQGGTFVRVDLSSGEVKEVPGAQTEGKVLAISPDGHWYAIGRQDGTVDVYDARSLRLVRHHALIDPIQRLVFSPDSTELAVEDSGNVLRVWDTCAVCENPAALAALAAKQSVRELNPGERATFHVN